MSGGDSISLMRLFHYMPYGLAGAVGEGQERIGSSPHTDWGFLTLILQVCISHTAWCLGHGCLGHVFLGVLVLRPGVQIANCMSFLVFTFNPGILDSDIAVCWSRFSNCVDFAGLKVEDTSERLHAFSHEYHLSESIFQKSLTSSLHGRTRLWQGYKSLKGVLGMTFHPYQAHLYVTLETMFRCSLVADFCLRYTG